MPKSNHRPRPAAPAFQTLEARAYMSFTSVAGFTIGRDHAAVTALAADRAGNVYATGTFQGVVDLNPARNRSALLDAADGNAFLARYSPAGRLAWAQQVPDSATINATTTDRAGNLYVAGQLLDTTDLNLDPARHFKLTPRGSWDAFVAKYDPAGALVWASSYGGGADLNSATSLTIDGPGYIHVAGTTSDGSAGSNVFLATFTTRGKFLRAATFGDTFNMNAPAGLAADPVGNVYLAGVNYNATTFHAAGSALPVPDNAAFLLKLNPRGKLAWIDTFDPFHQWAEAIVADASGVYVAGSNGGADLNPSNARTYTLATEGGYLAKYAPTGALSFASPIGDDFSVEADRLALDPATGDLVVAGLFSNSPNLNPTGPVFRVDSVGGVDAFVARYDRTGTFLTAASFGSLDIEDAPALAASAGRLFIGGKLSREIDFEPGPGERLLISAQDPFRRQAAYLVAYAWS